MAIRTELALRVPNSPGALADVCRVLSEARVNILLLSLDAAGHLRLLVDNPLHAAAALRDRRLEVTERDVITTSAPHAAGGLAPILRLASAAGVNVEYAYGGAAEGGLTATIVLGVADALAAATASGL